MGKPPSNKKRIFKPKEPAKVFEPIGTKLPDDSFRFGLLKVEWK
jgi:hypothetical protein